jgi:hypothetical protein
LSGNPQKGGFNFFRVIELLFPRLVSRCQALRDMARKGDYLYSSKSFIFRTQIGLGGAGLANSLFIPVKIFSSLRNYLDALLAIDSLRRWVRYTLLSNTLIEPLYVPNRASWSSTCSAWHS